MRSSGRLVRLRSRSRSDIDAATGSDRINGSALLNWQELPTCHQRLCHWQTCGRIRNDATFASRRRRCRRGNCKSVPIATARNSKNDTPRWNEALPVATWPPRGPTFVVSVGTRMKRDELYMQYQPARPHRRAQLDRKQNGDQGE